MQPQLNIIERVQRRNLTGLKFAGLVRLSFELLADTDYTGPILTGNDINNREEQERLTRECIERLGGTYVGTYNEPDTSAWKKKRIKQPDGSYKYRVIRPVLYGALDDLKASRSVSGHFIPAEGFDKNTQIDGIVVLDLDRLTRDQRTLEDIIEVAENYTRPFIDITGTLDLLTENGRDNARMLVTMAGKQSSATSRRGKQSHLSRAMRGIPVGGNRPFGWAEDKRTLVYREAIQIRAAARLLLAGVGASTIVRKWNETGRVTTKGNPWRRRTFALMMISPRMVGWRVYGSQSKPLHERYLTDESGQPVKGQYPAILDEKTWRDVVYLLAGPDRPKQNQPNAGKASQMLSTIIRCGNCGKKLTVQPKPVERFDYACKSPAAGGCGKVCGSGIAIDGLVTELIFARLENQTVIATATAWQGEDDLKQLNTTKDNLLAQFKENNDMGKYIWPEVRKVETDIAELMKERAAYVRSTATPKSTNIRESWPTLIVDQRRAIAAENFEAVILQPATKGSNRFNPERLVVVPR
ncbi:recombinase family protein [Streptomyces phaeochromogenes]|uniref:recombinase family protein n=1 Tax=Streptomyces phaeochromogenes TaxID=1923 RepID=UPI0036951C6D